MKDRSPSVYDLRLLIVIVMSVAFATITVYSQNQTPQTPAPAATAAQSPRPTPSPSPTPTPINWSTDPVLKRFVFRSIGPASMGGRIDDIAVSEQNPYVMYVAFATNGVWKSTNNGTTFQPIFDTYTTHSIGDVAIAPSDPNVVWVGTGEPNNRQSSSYGDGIYKSVDAGKTFTKMGLEDSQTIARIVIDPKDPNIVYAAVLGHLFGQNKERGVYKTTDGGKTWNNVKFIDEDTGFTDLAMDASDSKILYAASYQRRRTNFGFNGGGPGSGIWKTVDAGKTWKKLEGSGLPEGVIGRIGLDVSRSNPNVVYAQIEVGASTGTGGQEQTFGGQVAPSPSPGASPSPSPTPTPSPAASPTPAPPDPKKAGVWRSDDKGKTWRVVSNENNRPMYYSQIRVDPKNAETVYVGGLNFSKSTDGGKTFRSLQAGIAHVDNHAIWINPANSDHILLGNDGGLNVSYDQGATWEFVNTIPAAQFYAIGADMRKPYYVYGGLQDNGSWGGPSQTRNQIGITNADWYRVGGGDGFYTQIDPTDHNIVYYESQGGAMQRLDMRTGRTVSIRPRGVPQRRGGGPGGRQGGTPAASPSPGASPAATPTPDTQSQLAAFAQAQGFGGGFGGANLQSNVVPTPPVGEQYRFYWSSPIQLSPHNPRMVWAGGNRLFRSMDRGDTWTATIDLSKQIDRNTLSIMGVSGKDPMASKHDGYSGYGYIVSLAESPLVPGIVWVGTDDGNVQVSRDNGATWTNVSKNVPGIGETYHISRVEPSRYDAGTCYLAVDGHRLNDMKPYLFVTKDYGATWTSIVNNLPKWGNVNVIEEDPKNKELLYVGTEFGLFVSLNGGREWKPFMSGMPTMRIDDILVHPRDNDLIVGTHGRGIYILDDITPLQQLSQKVMDSEAHLFEVRPGTLWQNEIRLARYWGGAKIFRGTNPVPGTAVSYYLKSPASSDVKLTITDYTGKVVRNITGTNEAGLNRVQWNLRGDPPPRPTNAGGGGGGQGGQGGGGGGGGGGGFGGFAQGLPLEAGTYNLKLTIGGKDYTTKVVIEPDPGMN
jgi:photosystem II stability/assembly factor-like uncharacterized protein